MSDPQPPSPDDPLSETGQQRRDQMLPHLQGAMLEWHRRRRRNRHIALATVPVLLIALGVIWWQMSIAPSTPNPIPVAINIDPPTPVLPNPADIVVPHQVLIVDRIATDRNILDRYTVEHHTSIEVLDDDSLLALLAAMDRPTGLIAIQGEIRLTRNVVDSFVPPSPPPPGS